MEPARRNAPTASSQESKLILKEASFATSDHGTSDRVTSQESLAPAKGLAAPAEAATLGGPARPGLPLQGRTALITGASQGIGRAIAMRLAADGARVILAARNQGKLEAVAAEIERAHAAGSLAPARSAGAHAPSLVPSPVSPFVAPTVQPLDIGDEASIKAAVKAILASAPSIDILVNNAGITRDGLLMRMKRSDWDEVLSTNLTGTFLLTQALMSPMVRGRWGRIINITSVVGQTGQAGQANYAASKAALIGFTKSLARELASRAITVNAVAPGYIETAMTAVLDEKQRSAMLTHVPLARAGTDEEVAHAVAFLASPGAGYITGHVLDVNGGLYMG